MPTQTPTRTPTPTRTAPSPRPQIAPDTTREPQTWCPQQKRESGWEAV